jgi:hypothetical protein
VTDKAIAGVSCAETVSWRELIRERRIAGTNKERA